jgi:hypothetical protein
LGCAPIWLVVATFLLPTWLVDAALLAPAKWLA